MKEISKIYCVFMLDTNLNRDKLVCFYIISFKEIKIIQEKSSDPKDNFNEIKNLL